MADDNRIPTNQSQLDINASIQALNTQITALNALIADLGLVSITPISQQDYDALSQAEKLAGVFDIYDAAEPDIDGTKVSYDSNTNVVEKIDTIDDKELNRWSTNSAASAVSGRNLYKVANGLLHIWLNVQLTNALSAGDSLAILNGIEANFGVTLDANIGYVASTCITQDATKTAMFTAQQDKLFIVAGGSSIANTQSNRLWGYLAIPIQQ